jgi:putative phosphoribosyl transferase
MMRVFKDRHDAGAQLAQSLHRYSDASAAVVLAHTRTSVPVAYEVATRLGLPLETLAEAPRRLARGTRVEPWPGDDPSAMRAVDVADKIVLLVDDGDTAREMAIAIEKLRSRGAANVVAASAVVSPHVYAMLHAAADHVAVVLTPQHLNSIEAWYADLGEPSDEDVRQLLVAAAQNLLLLRRSNFLARGVDS